MSMKPKDQTSLLTLAGAGVGGYFGGVGGAGAGAQAGQMLGGMNEPEQKGPPPQLKQSETAIQRRMNQINETPLRQIADSIDSLKYIQDPVQRQELAQPLLQAQYMAMQKGQV